MTVSKRRPIDRHLRDSRQGAALVCVLICLLVVTALLANMMRSALRTQRQLQSEQALRQVEFLLNAGLERAAHHLERDDTYPGEIWHPRRDAFGRGNYSAEVSIRVDRAEEGQPSVIHIAAEYPAGTGRSVRRTQHVSVPPVP